MKNFLNCSQNVKILVACDMLTCVTFGVYRFWRAYIDGYSALGVVYEVSLEVVMTTHA